MHITGLAGHVGGSVNMWVNEKLLDAKLSFYQKRKAFVSRREVDWFLVKVGVLQGCVMSLWLGW